MADRWLSLAALTLARTAMGFQFQSLPAVGPQLVGDLAMSYATLGTLIGLYLLPGAVLALPGGWLGRRFGDKRVVLAGLGMMTVGGVLLALTGDTTVMMAARILSGAGAVLLNVMATKMVGDWFADRGIVTAMGILVVSWPLGIALAMVLLPGLTATFGWPAALLSGGAAAAACLVLVAAGYRAPPGAVSGATGPPRTALSRQEVGLSVLAGLVWAFYNMGLIIVLAFGPDYLIARGESAVAAAATVSIVSWLIMPSLVGGGWISERIGRPDVTVAVCTLFVAGLVWAVPLVGASVLLFIGLGLLFGPPAPLIMALPVEGVRTENRAVGMGIYFTCYYVGMAAAPPLAGLARDATEQPAAPLVVAGALLIAALAALLAFRGVQHRGALAA